MQQGCQSIHFLNNGFPFSRVQVFMLREFIQLLKTSENNKSTNLEISAFEHL